MSLYFPNAQCVLNTEKYVDMLSTANTGLSCFTTDLLPGRKFCLSMKSTWLAAYRKGLALTSSVYISLKFIILC